MSSLFGYDYIFVTLRFSPPYKVRVLRYALPISSMEGAGMDVAREINAALAIFQAEPPTADFLFAAIL